MLITLLLVMQQWSNLLMINCKKAESVLFLFTYNARQRGKMNLFEVTWF